MERKTIRLLHEDDKNLEIITCKVEAMEGVGGGGGGGGGGEREATICNLGTYMYFKVRQLALLILYLCTSVCLGWSGIPDNQCYST